MKYEKEVVLSFLKWKEENEYRLNNIDQPETSYTDAQLFDIYRTDHPSVATDLSAASDKTLQERAEAYAKAATEKHPMGQSHSGYIHALAKGSYLAGSKDNGGEKEISFADVHDMCFSLGIEMTGEMLREMTDYLHNRLKDKGEQSSEKEWVEIVVKMPKAGKNVRFTNGKKDFKGFWCPHKSVAIEFEDQDDDLPSYVFNDLEVGALYLHEGWYYEQHEHDDLGYYYPVYNVTHWQELSPLPAATINPQK